MPFTQIRVYLKYLFLSAAYNTNTTPYNRDDIIRLVISL